MERPDGTSTTTVRLTGLLGTVVELTVMSGHEVLSSHGVATGHEQVLERVEAAVVAEIDRLTAVFNVFDEASELRRVRRGEAVPGVELSTVQQMARAWCRRTGGAVHPGVDVVMALWHTAGEAGVLPDPAAVAEAVATLAASVEGPSDAAAATDLNALAKGWIVDRAAEAGCAVPGATGVMVSAGGDLRHLAEGVLRVGVEDARRRRDNAPPLQRIALPSGFGMATSGGQRRGWRIDGRWYSHVVDPRTGQPVDHVASASVVAPDTATADVVATALVVMSIEEGLSLVDGLGDVEALIVPAVGEPVCSPGWAALVLS